MTGQVRRQPGSIAAFVGRFVELRVAGGGLWRGRLLGINEGLLELERHGGRSVLVPVEMLVALCDEESIAGSMARGERDGGDV